MTDCAASPQAVIAELVDFAELAELTELTTLLQKFLSPPANPLL